MKRNILIWCGVLVAVWSSLAMGASPMRAENGLHKSLAPADIDYQTYIDANQLLMFVTNQGSFAYDNGAMFGKADGLYFPKGTKLSVIYAGGLWLGAKVGEDLRVSLAEYSHTYWPGPMQNGTFITGAAEDPQYHTYKLYKELVAKGFYDRPAPADPDSLKIWNDYDDWPVELGAPVDAQGKPLFTGDQTLWCVYNDANPAMHTNSSGSSEGLGVEVQQTTFAFNRTGPLGQCLFMKFLFVNKSPDTLADMYASVWADPDLGDAGDDLVGSDRDLSLGFCYNATNNDANYGKRPPAPGYDFFQGPIVPSEGDSAFFQGGWRQGYRNLPLTSFNKYINGTDPTSPEESYAYMQGLDRSGSPVTDPKTGEVTTYMMPGDPVAGTGWLDSDPADRRYMCSSGPFVMAPGDTQEVVVGVAVGQGSDRLTSVTALKFNDLYAQSAFDANFDLPDPPARPVVNAVSDDKAIILEWSTESEDNPGDYEFQGYNIYQGQSVAGPWKRVATYDLNDGTGIIFDLEFVVEEGAVINHPVQFGTDTGIKRHIRVTEDAWKGGPLHNVFDYYWAVTAFSYDPEKTPKTLENAQEVVTMAPQKPAGGFEYYGAYADTIDAEHIAGGSDGSVHAFVVDPTVLTGYDYRVTFTEGDEGTVWSLRDSTARTWVLQDQDNQSGDDTYLITDGFLCKVLGPAFGVKSIREHKGPGGVTVDPPDNVMYSRNSTSEWYVSSDQADNFARLNWRGHIGTSDWEFRFTAAGSEYYDWDSETKWPHRAPFEVWNIGIGTPDDPSDDKRIQFATLDDDGSGSWTPGDRIYPFEREYFEGLPEVMDYTWDDDFLIGRIKFNSRLDDPSIIVPREGTVVRFTTNKVNTTADVFVFTMPAVVESTLAADTAYTMKNIRVVPNPYFNQSLYEPDQFERRVKFTNLPYECDIKVFTLAGDHIVTLRKEPGDQSSYVWDMLTKHGLPLASGVYIYLVWAPDGREFVGKMAVFTEIEQLDTY